MSEPIKILQKHIENVKIEVRAEKIGTVIEVGDGITRVSGLYDVSMQEKVVFKTKSGTVDGVVFNLEEDTVGIIVLGNASAIAEGDIVSHSGVILSIDVGEELIGRVIDPLGNPLDNKGPIFKKGEKKSFAVERVAPGVTDREPVNTPLHTGIAAIDAMIPIGRGQRQLIIGDRQTGKTAIALDTIINQKTDQNFKTPICIYVAIGQKDAKVAQLIAELEAKGALDYSIIVVASASSTASMRYLAPYAATAIGEYFMESGDDALIIYDDLSKHAAAYRELSLLLRRPPGREAYPGDIFYLHSRLLERSARLNSKHGGGSLTSLPIIETQLGDVSAYIPTNVISITDGQIYLESELFNKGIRPAINAGLSVSRVGGAAQSKAMKKVAGKLRLDLAQYRELAAFSQFASELDEATKNTLERGKILTEILKQPELLPLPFEYEVVKIFAATNGFFQNIQNTKESDFTEYTENMLAYIHKMHGGILETIRTSGEFTEITRQELEAALQSFKNSVA